MKLKYSDFTDSKTPLLLISLASLLLLTWGIYNENKQHSHHSHPHPSAYSDYGPALFPSKQPDQIILNLTADPLSSVAVNWRTDSTIIQGQVQVSEATHSSKFQEDIRTIDATSTFFHNQYENEPEINAYYHSALIDQLKKGKKYVYRVGIDSIWSEWFQIKMPGPRQNTLKFIYFGDAQNDVKSLWSRVIREAYRKLPEVDFMLHAGDLINRANRDLEWGEWFQAGSIIHAMVPSMMTPGNHEYFKGHLSAQWKHQFSLPKNGPKTLEETCYQINYPNLKLISLNAEMVGHLDSSGMTQAIWLDSILTQDPRKWTAITLHYPLYSTKDDRDNLRLRALIKPIFDKHRVDIVLQGHDHAYGRGMVKNEVVGTNTHDKGSGTMYVVSVSGPKMYEISDKSWMTRRAGNTQLFQVISVAGNKLSYEAYTARGDLYDAFDLIKKGNQVNTVIDRIPLTPERLNRQVIAK